MQINKIKEFIDEVSSKIKYKPIRECVCDELKNHIEELKEEYMQTGKNSEVAEHEAILDMGDPQDIGIALNKVHSPKIDYKLIIIMFILITISLFVTYSLSNNLYSDLVGSNNLFLKNVIFIMIGSAIGVGIYFIDYTKFKNISGIIYIFSSLTVVIYMFLKSINNYNSYIEILNMNIEMIFANTVVPLYIVSFSGFMTKFDLKRKNDIILLIILSVFSLYITSYYGDLIYLLILSAGYISISIMEIFKTKNYSSKYKKRTISIYAILGIILVSLFLFCNYSKYPIFSIYISNTNVIPNIGLYNEYQHGVKKDILESAKVIGNADINNKIIDDIESKELNYGLQDAKSTEILSYIIGNYGIILGVIVISCILILLFKIILSAKSVRDAYGKYIIIGLSVMIITQSILNILSNLCIIPPNSAIIPIISFSGIGTSISIVVLVYILSIYRRKDILLTKNLIVNKD